MALLGTGITSGHSAVSQAAVRPCRLQLCAMVGRARVSSYVYHFFLSSPSDPKFMHIYRLSQEECARLRESVPYVKVY